MKIVIPKQYREKFVGGRAFVVRWPWHGVLVTNKKMFDELERRTNLLIARGYDRARLLQFATEAAVRVKLDKNGAFECPKWLVWWLGKGRLEYTKDYWEFGVVASAGKWKGREWHKKSKVKRVGSENQEKRNQLMKQLSTQVGRCFICGADSSVKRRDVKFQCLHMEAKLEREQAG